ncbi:hypothetical protein [Gracilibacillus timonensis]|uniref:hypothetical protein n=1 Tax=Gracilibacillus timonensis TaxID=1816696 RepID=UPI0008257027|nr:hypothetical protein [Gracilibacillus timonensis]
MHGINGYDVMNGNTEAVQDISEAILSLGVTCFLSTTLTSSEADLKQVITAIRDAVKQRLQGAQSEDMFLEGPYL